MGHSTKDRRRTTHRAHRRVPDRLRPDVQRLEDRTLLNGAPELSRLADLLEEPGASGTPEALDLVLISRGVPRAEEVEATARPGTLTLLYDQNETDVAALIGQIQEVASTHGGVPIGHLSLVTHGGPGRLAVGGGEWWTVDSFDAQPDDFRKLRSLLAEGARIDLYGCDVAAGVVGRAFVDRLAEATGAVVSASDDDVGSGEAGDYDWEYATDAGPRPPDLLDVEALEQLEGFSLTGDWAEPNDYDWSAYAFGSIQGWRVYTDLTMTSTFDVDWFTFQTSSTGTAASLVRISFDNSWGDLDLEVYHSSGILVGSSTGTGDDETVFLNGWPAGTYYVKVYEADWDANPNYTLKILPPGPDYLEPNNSSGAATVLGTNVGYHELKALNIHNSSDADWFVFNTLGPGTSADYAKIQFVHSYGDLDLELYNSVGGLVDSSTSTSNDEEISLDGLSAGTYYLRVFGFAGATNPIYHLYFNFPQAATGDAFEPNDSSGTATDFGTLQGENTWDNLSIHVPGDFDWFRFTTTRDSAVGDEIRIDFSHAQGDLDIWLYDQYGTLLAWSMGASDTERILLNGLPAGTYYAVVYGYNFATNPDYSLTIDVPGAIVADSLESHDGYSDNNTLARAYDFGQVAGVQTWGNDPQNPLTIHDPSDLDVYSFTTTAVGRPSHFARIDFSNSEGDLDFWLLDAAGNLLSYSLGTGDNEQISLSGLPAGSYYLVVYGFYGAVSPGYSLTLYAPQSPTTDILESHGSYTDNDSLDHAYDLGTFSGNKSWGPLSITTGDHDWFRFDLPAGATNGHLAAIDFDPVLGDLDLRLLNASGVELARSTGVTGREQISLAGRPAGTYYVEVYGYAGATNPDYRLTVSVPGGPIVDAAQFEPNDTLGTAHDFGRLRGFQSWGTTANPLAISDGDDEDWYRFELVQAASTGHVLGIAFNNDLGDLDLALYDSAGNSIAGYPASTGVRNIEEIDLSGLPAGVYYAQVYGDNNAANPAYGLYLNAPGGDRFEYNQTRNDAADLGVAQPDGQSAGVRTWTRLSIESGDQDWYKFPLDASPVSGNRVRIDFDHTRGDLDLELVDGTGNVLRASRGVGNSEEIALTNLGLSAGTTYYIHVLGFNGAVNPLYSLTIDAPLSAGPDWAEAHDGETDNDDRTRAYALNTVEGLRTWDNPSQPLSIHSTSDVDWYSFTTTGPGIEGHYAAIGFAHARGDLDLRLYDASGRELARSTTAADVEQVSLAGLPAGQYYLEVRGYGGATNGAYSIAINAPQGASGDWAESNDTQGEARDLHLVSGPFVSGGLSIHQAGDVDWFRFETAGVGDEGHAVAIGFDQDLGDLGLELYDGSGNLLASSDGIEDTERIDLAGRPAGEYYLRVFGHDGSTTNPDYALAINAPPSADGDWAEPNASRISAHDLRQLQGQQYWGGLSVHNAGDEDWFRIETTADGREGNFVGIAFDNTLGDLDLWLYDASGAELASSRTSNGFERIWLVGRPAGEYFLRVAGHSGATNPQYWLVADTPAPSIPADWAEPNDSQPTARDLQQVQGVRTWSGLSIHASGNADWYRFTTTGAAVEGHVARIDFDHTRGDLTLELFDASGNAIAGYPASAGTSNREQISLAGLAAGSYSLRVTGASGATNPSYSLTIDAPQPSQADWAEAHAGLSDNNTQARAYDLREVRGTTVLTGLSIHSASEEDWFTFQTALASGPGQLVRIDFREALGALELSLYDPAGNPVGTAVVVNGSARVSMAGLPAGSYSVRVRGAINPDYTLTIAASPILSPDWTEPNNDASDPDDYAMAYDLRQVADWLSAGRGRDLGLGSILGPGLTNALFPGGVFNGNGQVGNLWSQTHGFDPTNSQSAYSPLNPNYIVPGPSLFTPYLHNLNNPQNMQNAMGAVNLGGSAVGSFIGALGLDLPLGYDPQLSGIPISQSSPFGSHNMNIGALNNGFQTSSAIGGILQNNAPQNQPFLLMNGNTIPTSFGGFNPSGLPNDLAQFTNYGYVNQNSSGFGGSSSFNTSPVQTSFNNVGSSSLANNLVTALALVLIVNSLRNADASGNRGVAGIDDLVARDSAGVQRVAVLPNLSIDSASDVDWFRFDLDNDGREGQYVAINYDHGLGALALELFDSQGELVDAVSGADDVARVGLARLASGTYYVRVSGQAGATNPSYTLTLNVPPPLDPSGDWAESNDTQGEARDLRTLRGPHVFTDLSIHSETDEDWFTFTTAATGGASNVVRINFNHAQGDLDLALYDSAGNFIDDSTGTSNFEALSLDGLPIGTYALRIYGYAGATSPNYTLSIDAPRDSVAPDGLEPNDTATRAADLDVLSGVSRISGLSIHPSDVDWFTFTLEAAGTSAHSVGIEFDPAIGDLRLDLYASSDLVNPLRSSNGSTGSEQITLQGLTAGTTYFLHVSGVSGATNRYDLNIDAPTAPAQATDSWTILVYMTASDLASFAFADINEMEVAASRLPGTVNIVALYDQSATLPAYTYPTGNLTQPAWGGAGWGIIRPDTNPFVIATPFTGLYGSTLDELNTGSSQTLADYITTAIAAAPASRYSLVIWDHGAGVFGTNADNSDYAPSDILTPSELDTALDLAGVHFDVISFDACLMAMAEVGYTLRDHADVIAASQEVEGGAGYNYETAFASLLRRPELATAASFASGLVQSYQDEYLLDPQGSDTYSAARASDYGGLADALLDFTSAVAGFATAGDWLLLRQARAAATSFQSFPEYRDLGQFAALVAASPVSSTIGATALGVVGALDNLIFAQTIDQRNTSGLSIYLPGPGQTISSQYSSVASGFLSATGWGTFLQAMVGGSATTTARPDWAESNNTVARSTNLYGLAGAGHTFNGLSLHRPDDVDWFRFTTFATGDLVSAVGVAYSGPGTVRLALYDNGLNFLGESATGSGLESLSLAGLPAGQYHVAIYGGNGQAVPSYALRVDAPAGPFGRSDWARGNDNIDKADDLGTIDAEEVFSGLTFEDGVTDWFRFTTPRNHGARTGVVTIAPIGTGTITASLLDEQGRVVDLATGTGDQSLSFPAGGGGTFRLSVSSSEPGDFALLFSEAPYITVFNTDDAGLGSLRQAILNANEAEGHDEIRFRIQGGSTTILPTSALPTITDPVTIDATTQPGFAGTPIVALDGSSAGGANGLVISAGGSTLRGLAIHSFAWSGVVLVTLGGNVLEGNSIGTNPDGVADFGNAVQGLYIGPGSPGNTIGGTSPGAGNVISGNDDVGVWVNGSANNVFLGNFIGTDAAGTGAIPNTRQGIFISGGATGNVIGGTEPGSRNLISGNDTDGIVVLDDGTDGNTILGNFIGVDVTGAAPLGNGQRGVAIFGGAADNVVGGTTAAARNVISDNGWDGVGLIHAGTTGNRVEGNSIGTNADGDAALGNHGRGVIIFLGASDNLIGGKAQGAGNLISGNLDDGISLINPGTTGNVIAGNFIGTIASGDAPLGNAHRGVTIYDQAANNVIGGAEPGAGNVLSGNGWDGIGLFDAGTTGNIIAGNFIGTDATGTIPIGNTYYGIVLESGSSGNILGLADAGNVIAYSGQAGVRVSGSGTIGNTIRFNAIHSNIGLGIDLNDDGVTANDATDSDTGPNGLLNFPTLDAATAGGTTRVGGVFQGAANTTLTIDFYADPNLDGSGHGEGRRWIGSTTVITDALGAAPFDVTLGGATVAGEWITATATDATGNTSEFAASVVAEAPVSLSIDDISVVEGDSGPVQAVFTVSLSALSNWTITVHYATLDGDANAPDDYAATSGQLTFLPGQMTQTISVDVQGDTLPEGEESFSVLLSGADHALIDDTEGQGTIQDDDLVSTLIVTSVTPTASGVVVLFNRPLNPATLNLYDNSGGSLGPADVVLTGPSGVVSGNLVVNPGNQSVTFIRSGGLLPAGAYSLTLRSAANGFVDTSAGMLDGNGDGTTGDAHTTNFTVATLPAKVVSVPDVLRGPTQKLALGTATTLPITINNGTGVYGVQFTLAFDPAILSINSITPGAGVPGSWSLLTNVDNVAGTATVDFSSGVAPLSAGSSPLAFLNIDANVRSNASYASKEVLDINGLLVADVNGDPLASAGDDGLHVVGFPGDVTGNGSVTIADSTQLRRFFAGLTTAFVGFQNVDPAIVADVNGGGTATIADSTQLLRFLAGLSSSMPSVPPGYAAPAFGYDPKLSLPDVVAAPGERISVPLRLEHTDAVPVDLDSFEAVIQYDPSAFRVAGVRVGSLAEGFELIVRVDESAGLIIVGGGGLTALHLRPGDAGNLVWLDLEVSEDATEGVRPLNLRDGADAGNRGTVKTQLNEGRLVVLPAPTDAADDPADGTIRIVRRPAPTFGPLGTPAAGLGGSTRIPLVVGPIGTTDLAPPATPTRGGDSPAPVATPAPSTVLVDAALELIAGRKRSAILWL